MSIRIGPRSVFRRFIPKSGELGRVAPVSTPVLDLAPTAMAPGPIRGGLSLAPEVAKPVRKLAPKTKVPKQVRDLARLLAQKVANDEKKRGELCQCGLRLDADHRRENCDLNSGILGIAGSRSGASGRARGALDERSEGR